MFVKPNFLPDLPLLDNGTGDYAVFLGRLSYEKGIDVLLSALKDIKNGSFHVKIVGYGPLREQAEAKAR